MRTVPPHPLIRYRHMLLAVALSGWGVAAVTLSQFKDNAAVPVQAVVALAALVFIWCNGLYWWVMLRYPYIDMGNGNFASRNEWKGQSNAAFFAAYFLVAVFASVACVRVGFGG